MWSLSCIQSSRRVSPALQKQMLRCPQQIQICSWEKKGIVVKFQNVLHFTISSFIFNCYYQLLCEIQIWHTWSNKALVSLFFTFITVFFSVIQRAEMSNSQLIWVLLFYSLIKICIHGYTTVRTANIRVTTLYIYIVASYPKANNFLWVGNSI